MRRGAWAGGSRGMVFFLCVITTMVLGAGGRGKRAMLGASHNHHCVSYACVGGHGAWGTPTQTGVAARVAVASEWVARRARRPILHPLTATDSHAKGKTVTPGDGTGGRGWPADNRRPRPPPARPHHPVHVRPPT